jgi:hypothetical protein
MSKNYIFSLSLSIITFIVSTLFFIRNKHYDRLYSLILICYSLISYNDYIIYKSIIDNDIELNHFATRNIYYLLWSQVLFIGVGIYFISKDYSIAILGMLLLYYGHKNARKTWGKSDIATTSNNTIIYGFDEKCIQILIYILLFCLVRYTDYKKTLPIILILFVTFYTNVLHDNTNISNWLYIPSLLSIPLYIATEYFYI